MSEMEMVVTTSQTTEDGRRILQEGMEEAIREAFRHEMEVEKEHMKNRDIGLPKKNKIRIIK